MLRRFDIDISLFFCHFSLLRFDIDVVDTLYFHAAASC